MSARELVIVGGGEHGRVVMEAARSRPDQWRLLGFLDPRPCEETVRSQGVPWLGDDEAGRRLTASPSVLLGLGVGTIGVNEVRRRLVQRYAVEADRWAIIVHAASAVSPTARLEPGCFVAAGAVVGSGSRIGEHAIVNTGAIVDHDVVIAGFVQVGPGAVLGGGVAVGEGSYLGLGCRIRNHVKVGAQALVGMGAVVVGDVPAGDEVLGVPARSRVARGGP